MVRPLGLTGLHVSPIGFGAFKIGRNEGTKYPQDYALPDDAAVADLVAACVDMGINHVDTAPAYGTSEERLGAVIGPWREHLVLSTKVGEVFEDGASRFDFTAAGVRASVERSLRRLRVDAVDIVLIHSSGDDCAIMNQTDVVPTLHALRDAGMTRAIGLSGKTVEGALAALTWADVLMIPLNVDDTAHEAVLAPAGDRGVGLMVKKGLASGHLPADGAIRYLLGHAAISNIVVGSLNEQHLRANLSTALDALA
ncbi:MAG: aldo/keto reductase [Planctomycetota bacterium]|jgi:aryl-alcohol dehydrogenase-like predicted oxidoreductase